jgi:pyruvate carboxylase
MAQRALTAFGNSEIYIEEYIPKCVIEVQIMADNKGTRSI